MTLRYEINPPKINPNENQSSEEILKLLQKVRARVSEIDALCDGVHFTDSVLGLPRISPIISGKHVRESNKKIEITASLRVRDKNLSTLEKLMDDAVKVGLNGVLILKGDPSQNEQKESGLIPSQIVKHLKELGFDKKLDLYLSLPSNPNIDKIQKKIDVQPTGFVTQVIHSAEEVSRIVENLKPRGFQIIPCILLPSEKNTKSAKFLNLDWSSYENSVVDFIKNIQGIAGDILITSPNDFNYAKEILKQL